MYDNNKQVENTKQEPKKIKYSTQWEYQKANLQVALIVMWRIHNKKYTVGSKIFFEEIEEHIEGVKNKKEPFRMGLMFLEGAGIAVDGIIVTDKVSPNLLQRYGITNE
ncbi:MULTISPECIES: hypothetical protein [Carnobacterium]|jgi:FMN phosphatase YigB (HAD superfamily)|uniref:hypothetical protein n=1 Tax=Carnobacterium TaxID=2747 RepID=UPI000E71F674|nr:MULTISPECIES: hypothetical protein [Carnobacterium]AOA04159.1 hypothetical protein BFC23_15945 [Carnobacterium maltaromaticum]MBQ6485270.1 hypothetical protein [Carnobacterium sp.]TFJ73101.1 hypothetical protein CKN94_10700 [Carnobacterium maltaromaticum]TFJ77964.1 hypothetical protein CKN97_10010 [Carnobacterium maltaromaticum]